MVFRKWPPPDWKFSSDSAIYSVAVIAQGANPWGCDPGPVAVSAAAGPTESWLPRQDSDLDFRGSKPGVLPLDHGAPKSRFGAASFTLHGPGSGSACSSSPPSPVGNLGGGSLLSSCFAILLAILVRTGRVVLGYGETKIENNTKGAHELVPLDLSPPPPLWRQAG